MAINNNFFNNFKNDIPSEFNILCDLDGTLIFTDYANYLSYVHAIEEVTNQKHDIQFNSKKRLNREELKARIPDLTEDQFDTIVSLKSKYFSKYLSETRVNVSFVEFIKKHSGTNNTFLVTCCREKRAIETLQHHNLLRHFSRLICWETLSEHGQSNKYLNAITLLNLNPVSTIVCENDIIDIYQAKQAGVPRKNIISIEG